MEYSMSWKILFFVSAFIGLGYPLACIGYFKKVPTTISATWYDLKERDSRLIWAFQVWSWGTIYTLAPMLFRMSEFDNGKSIFACLTCCSLFMVGFFPKYREHQGIFHYGAAFLCAAFAEAWACLLELSIVPFCYLPVMLICSIAKPNSTGYFAEMLAFFSIYTVIGMYLW